MLECVTFAAGYIVTHYDSFAKLRLLRRQQYVIESQFMAFCSAIICRINLKSKINFFLYLFSVYVQFVYLSARYEIVAEANAISQNYSLIEGCNKLNKQ